MSKFNYDVGACKIMEMANDGNTRVHFVGVGGVGMYSLFRLTEVCGAAVSGSDREKSHLSERLISLGKNVRVGHRWENAEGADLVVYSLAVAFDNPELVYAKKNSIPTVTRAEYLGALMKEYKERIGVSGTHGKSTTTAMIDAVFHLSGKEPTTVLGAIIPGEKEPLRIGERDYFIYEACEYKDAFLSFCPTAAVFTNLELDHVDYFKDINSLKASFLQAMDASPRVILNCDDENLASLMKKTKSRCISYGFSEHADYRIIITDSYNGAYSFKIRHEGQDKASISLKAPGKFNVMNAAAATTLALEFGIDKSVIESALGSFSGVERRIESLGEYNGARVYYDYAHHPTEIECAIKAVREINPGPVAVIFKPHTYSRTAAFIDKFASALSLADEIFVCEVSAVRESENGKVSSHLLVSKLGDRAKYLCNEAGVSNFVSKDAKSIVIMGAANLDAVKSSFFGK